MNKKNIWPIALIVLPVLAMIFACMPNAVTYQYPDGGKTIYMTYFGLCEDAENSICLPAAGIAVGLCLLFAVAYVIAKKSHWLKAVSGPSFAAALLAAMPYFLKEDITIVPSVIVPVLMLLEWLVAYKLSKQAEFHQPVESKARRLEKR